MLLIPILNQRSKGFLACLIGAYMQNLSGGFLQYLIGVDTYTETAGWVYTFGRYNINMLNRVTMEDGAFTVQGVRVSDEAGYGAAKEIAASLYDDYKECFNRIVVQKKEKQKQNTARRKEREKKELETLINLVDKERFNI